MSEPKRVLVLAYKFPDVIVPGGSTRIEKFLDCLPARWRPVVVSVRLPESELTEAVHRRPPIYRTPSHYGAFARAYRAARLAPDTGGRAGRIELFRRLKNLVLVPDDAVLWWPFAISAALRAARRHRPEVVFTSGPPFSGFLLGSLVAGAIGKPLVADFRDDWAGNPLIGVRNVTQRLTEHPMERWSIRRAARIVHVTEASLRLYRERYPAAADRMRLIRNGYDEADFEGISAEEKPPGRLRLLHTGSLRGARSPAPLFEAMERVGGTDGIEIRFSQVGTTHREHREHAIGAGIADRIDFTDRLPHASAVELMVRSDALVLIPSAGAPTAIPGKAYEYLRAGRPVLTISEANETTRFLRPFRGVRIFRPDDVKGIAACLAEWYRAVAPEGPDRASVLQYSRQSQAARLANLLDELL